MRKSRTLPTAQGPPARGARWPQPLLVVGLLAAAALCALCLGTPYVPPHRLPATVLDGDATLAGIVVTELRLPRLLLALVAGACLGAAGLVLQEALRNPLAVPEMLGVSSGAALGVAAPLVLALSLPAAVLRVASAADRAVRGSRAKLTRDRARYYGHPDWTAHDTPPPAL